MRLYLLDQFVEEMATSSSLRVDEKDWMDRAFDNEIIGLANHTKNAFDRIAYRDALKFGFFDFATIRDLYRNICGPRGMHKSCITRWIETQAVILSPLAPHIAEYIWTVRLNKPTLVVEQPWPVFEDVYDLVLHREFECLFNSLEDFRRVKEKTVSSSKKQKAKNVSATDSTTAPYNSAVIYVAKDYLPWQQTVLKALQTVPLNESQRAPVDPGFMNVIKSCPELSELDKKLTKDVMSFASFRMKVLIISTKILMIKFNGYQEMKRLFCPFFFQDDLMARGPNALELQLPFDEGALMKNNFEFILRSLGLDFLDIRWNTEQKHEKDETDRLE